MLVDGLDLDQSRRLWTYHASVGVWISLTDLMSARRGAGASSTDIFGYERLFRLCHGVLLNRRTLRGMHSIGFVGLFIFFHYAYGHCCGRVSVLLGRRHWWYFGAGADAGAVAACQTLRTPH